MKLERRIRALEKTIARQQEKLLIVTAELLAMRSLAISAAPVIASSSSAQLAALKHRTLDRLTNHLLAGWISGELADEATISLEELFYEIDGARNEAGLPPPAAS